MIKYISRAAILLLLIIIAYAPANAAPGDRYSVELILADAALNADGDLYVVNNTWTSLNKNLTHIRPDRTIDWDFHLERYDDCCNVNPFAVGVDAKGNIYIVSYQPDSFDFLLAKYGKDGELITDWGVKGVLRHPFGTLLDMEVSPDGAIYVLDRDGPELYMVSPDGTQVTGLIRRYYDLVSPTKFKLGPDGQIYIFDEYDPVSDPRAQVTQGIKAFNADGSPVEDFGVLYNDINSGDYPLSYASFVVDVDGSLWVLGTLANTGPLSAAYHFTSAGEYIGMSMLDYRLAESDPAAGIIADNENGFIIFEIANVSITAFRYKPDGGVREKFSAEIFKRPY